MHASFSAVNGVSFVNATAKGRKVNSALGLVVNMIVLWNTIYTVAVLGQLRKEEYPVNDLCFPGPTRREWNSVHYDATSFSRDPG